MHDSIQRRLTAPQASGLRFRFASAAPLALALLTSPLLAAQSDSQTDSQTQPRAHLRSGQSHPPTPLHAQAAPPAPPKPDWPINDEPKPASILWNRDELRIDATNSSLQQIMTDVASATGASVDGLAKDERVFGAYGPAPARDVLAQLLQGTGYNIVMVGDQGQGAPRQIILSARNTGPAPQNNSRPAPEEEEDVAPEPQYEPPPQAERPNIPPQAMRPGFIPGAPGTYVNQQPGQAPQQPGQPIQQPQVQPLQQPNQQNQ
jgi:hypothetical protein